MKRLLEAKADFDRMVNILVDYDLANSNEAILLVNKFKDFRNRNLIKGRDRDISTWYNRPVEFIDFIEDLESKKSKTELAKLAKKGAELVAENNEWKVYRIYTHAASCLYGKGTKWCTTERDSRYFDNYKDRGVVLYYIISDNKKYAIALYPNIIDTLQEYGIRTNFELFDEKDNRIIDKEELEGVLNKFPKIPNVELILEFLSAEIRDNVLIRVYPHNSGEFIIPDSVTSIGSNAFDGCFNLTSIIIPDSVTSIGNNAFDGCRSLTSITIPKSVTSIGNYAFSNCKSLTSVAIPDSVTSIGDYAFFNCDSLTSIIIPDSVTSIGKGVFFDCSSLTSITIPDSVTSIGNNAFQYCSALTSITIPSSVTSIGNDAFFNCSALTSITIPDSVTSIGKGVFFDCSSLTSVTIPDSITSIEDYTFQYCSALTLITIPDSVTSIGNSAFYNCSALTSITIPDSVTSIDNYAFYGCSSLKSIIIPKSVTSIGNGAFFDCHNLTIYAEAESKPKKWHQTWAPDYITVIWGYKRIKNLKEAKADFDRMVNILIDYDLADSNEALSLVNKFKGFRDRNLIKGQDRDISTWYNRPVEFIDFIEDLESKKSKTQKNKQAKEGAELVAENNEWKVYRIYTHTASCLYGKGTKWCTAGKDSKYFDNYKDRGVVLYYIISDNKKYAIALYPKIVNVLQEYGIKANFELFDEEDNKIINKEELENVLNKFPKIPNVKLILEFLPAEIRDDVLIKVYPYNSGEFIIPDGITSIGNDAFYNCSALTSITIPDSVTSIGDYTFANCSSLTSITIPDSVTSIGNGTFSHCSSLTSITIPDGVTSIGNGTFQYCTALTSVTIPNSITSIGNNAFINCISLTNITIPDSVTSIGNYAFFNCRSLTSIIIPKSVTRIGSYAFLMYDNLTIYVEAESKPQRWRKTWASDDIPVVWGYKQTKHLKEAKADFDRMVNILVDYDLANSNEAILLVNKFKDLKDRNLINSRDRDISTWYNRPVEFINFIEGLENKKSKTQKNKQAKEGAELVARNNEWKVYKIDTWEASCLYGKGTKWCTAGKNSKYFDNYKKNRGAILYYIISDNKKYAIALYPKIVDSLLRQGVKANFELFDEADNKIINKEELENVLNKFPKIPNVELTFEFLPAKIKGKVLIKVYPHNSGEFIIPDGITSIGDYAFLNCTELTSITIPNSVTSIGDYAFHGCSSLTSITIPDSVTSIGNGTFQFCSALTSITIPSSVTSIGNNVFLDCSALTSITIPSSVTSIGDLAFFGCSSLTSITIPKSVTSIGEYAFYRCFNLTIYTEAESKPKGWHQTWVPGDIPVIWGYKQIKNLREAKADFDRMVNILIDYDLANSNEAVSLINKFKDFRDRNLIKGQDRDISTWYSRPVEFIDFIEDLESKKSKTQKNKQAKDVGATLVYEDEEWFIYRIDTWEASCLYGKSTKWCISSKNSKFWDDYAKATVYFCISKILPESNPFHKIAIIIDYIPNYYLTTITEVYDAEDNELDIEDLPDSLYYLLYDVMIYEDPRDTNKGLFTIHDGVLTTVNVHSADILEVPEGVTHIGYKAFTRVKVKKVILPEGLVSISADAFRDCIYLEEVILPSTLETIGTWAFINTNLTEIELPESLEELGKNPFDLDTLLIIPDTISDDIYYEIAYETMYEYKVIKTK